MLSGIVLVMAATSALLISGTPVFETLITLGVGGGAFVFTVIPHLVAYWLEEDVNDLLRISNRNRHLLQPGF
jgi:hypothetical protein